MSALDDVDLSAIAGERPRAGRVLPPNLVEELTRENAGPRAEVQRSRVEIGRLKGEEELP